MSMNVRKELLHVSITATTQLAVIHAAVRLFTRSAAMDTTISYVAIVGSAGGFLILSTLICLLVCCYKNIRGKKDEPSEL